MKVRIYYHHTDSGGVVYYANYLKFLEEGRTEFLEEKGISINELIKQDTQLVVYRQEIDYKSPSFYADTLQIDTRLSNLSRTRIEFEYEVKNQNGKVVCTAKTLMACVGIDFKPKAIPENIQKRLAQK